MGKTLVLNSRIMIIETKNDPTNQETNHNLNKFKQRSFPSPLANFVCTYSSHSLI